MVKRIYTLIILAVALCISLGATAATSTTVAHAKTIVEKVKKSVAPDSRQAIFDVTAAKSGNGVKLSGTVSEARFIDSLQQAFSKAGVKFQNDITALPTNLWALSRISVSCLRTAPKHAAEMASQAVMGLPMRVLEQNDDWYRVQTPDGYIAYVTSPSIAIMTDDEMAKWRTAPRLIVTSIYQIRAYTTPTAVGVRDVVTDLVNGCIVEGSYDKPVNGRVEITLPDGRKGWVDRSAVSTIEDWSKQDFDAEYILDMAYSMEGQPYLWGGTSTKSLDCSGLAKVCYFANGIILMRDASQQALTGTRIEASDWRNCRAGDLLFFGNATTRRVTHVAIYDHDGNYVHSSGRVKRNSVDPDSEAYLTTPFLHAVRIHGNEGTAGITQARNHPWFFDIK
jgi:cell wall-associated NlpC family hydrolase